MPFPHTWLNECDCCRLIETTYRHAGRAICSVCRYLCSTEEGALCVVNLEIVRFRADQRLSSTLPDVGDGDRGEGCDDAS